MPRDTAPEECPYRFREDLPCGCSTKCMMPSAEAFKEANAHDFSYVVMGGKLYTVSAGSSCEVQSDGTQITREYHFDGRPTKVTTYRPGRRKGTRYETRKP